MAEEVKDAVPAPSQPSVPTTPPAPKSLTSRSVFSHPEAHPLALDVVLLKHFQLEWLSWLPDTLFHEIEQTFTTTIAEVNKYKILAAQTLHVVDTFWEEWEIFEKTILALNGIVPRIDTVQPPDLSMLMAGLEMANSIRQETYNAEIGRYCAAVFLHENVFYAPEPASFCQEYIDQPHYTCGDCHKVGSALPPFDGICYSCGGHFDSEHPFRLEPSAEAVKSGAGKNLQLHNTFDAEPIKKRFTQLNALPGDQLRAAIQETMEDTQSAKLIIAVDFMKHRAQQLAEQLTSLRGWLEMS